MVCHLGWDLTVLPHADEILGLWVKSVKQRYHVIRPTVRNIQTLVRITCSKAVLDLEANPLELFIAEETDPHEASTGEDLSRTGCATEAIDEWWEAKGTISHLDVVEATLKRGLDVEGFVKLQLYSLAWLCWGKMGSVTSAARKVFSIVIASDSVSSLLSA